MGEKYLDNSPRLGVYFRPLQDGLIKVNDDLFASC